MSIADVDSSTAKQRRFPIRLPFGMSWRMVAWLLAGLAFCILPAWLYVCRFVKRTQSVSHLKTIAISLHNYHDTYTCFPPSTMKLNGAPAHSWRALIVPFLGPKFEGVAEFQRGYRLDDPWNGPHNRPLLETKWFGKTTQYLAVVGPDTMWPPDGCRTIRDVADGLGNTILVVETSTSRIRWFEPGDLLLVGRDLYLPGPEKKPLSIAGCNVVMADGSFHRLSPTISPDQVQALLTVNGGEPHFCPSTLEREE